MGGEFGQRREWQHDQSLEWELLELPIHAKLQRWVAELNRFYRESRALHEADFESVGFEWIDCNDADTGVISLLRKGRRDEAAVLAVCNFTPVARTNYRVGAPCGGIWREPLNSDAIEYGGSGAGNLGEVEAAPIPFHGRRYSLFLSLPPLAIIFLSSHASLSAQGIQRDQGSGQR